MERAWEQGVPKACWSGLTYQLLQTQGAQQSISLSSGYLDCGYLETIKERAGMEVSQRWCQLLWADQKASNLELDNLIDALLHRRAASWMEHLRDMAHLAYNRHRISLSLYQVSEVKEITKAMSVLKTSPLRTVLERNQGTLRIGRALRLLGRYNQSSLRDLIDKFNTVQDADQLLDMVAQATQECELATARTEFMIVPNENDLVYLLSDIEMYGARTIARLLIVLSAVRYTTTEQNGLTQSTIIDEDITE